MQALAARYRAEALSHQQRGESLARAIATFREEAQSSVAEARQSTAKQAHEVAELRYKSGVQQSVTVPIEELTLIVVVWVCVRE